jgi:protein ImuB
MAMTVSSRRRLLALWLPYLAIDRLRQTKFRGQYHDHGAAPGEPPLVVAEKVDNALHLSAIDERALRLGLHRGMPLADARAMVPALTVVEADPHADAALLSAIADWCDRFTPLVAFDGKDGLLLDISGCAHLFGGESAMADRILRFMASQGMRAQTAIAGTAISASALARFSPNTIVAPGEEEDAMIGLPVAAVTRDEGIIIGLRRAGLKTIGDVLTRSPAELAARFGAGFTAVLDQALGRSDAPISPRKPLPDYVAEKRFAEPVATDAVIANAIFSLAATLTSLLERHGEGARRIEASFFRTDGAVRRLVVETGRPVCDPSVIERLFQERLDALADPLDPGFGFDLIRLAASRTMAITPAQQGFDTAAHEAEDIAILTDRLATRLGARRVVRYVPQESHIPEYAELAVPVQQVPASRTVWPTRTPAEPPQRPLRLFERPEQIEVMAEVPDGPPVRFLWRRVFRNVARAEGPERIAMEWWKRDGKALTRDYFRVEDESGLRFWLYRDGLYGRETARAGWFVHGLFA